ncbi:TPA: glycosyltransferase family 4 protein [Escherichia coli]|nr:glycosyltransferase family 4 protein [Escherichia coli]
MKILFTESSPNIGGQELQVLAQMQALMRGGHEVLLACRERSRIAGRAVMQGIPVVFIPFRNSLHLPSLISMRRLMVRFRPDVVVSHSGHDSNTVGIARRTLSGDSSRFVIIRQKTYMTRDMKMFSLNHMCDVVVVPSEEMRSCLIHRMCRQSVVVIPPGIDFAGLRKQADEALPEHIDVWLKKREPAPVVVQVGMIRPEKGHDFMLEVLFRLKQQGVRFYWLIVGSGCREEEARLKAKIDSLGMNDCVLMCGLMSPVAPVYRKASLMVMPSRNEAFGMALVEATVCGVPVMASRVGGIPSVIHHGYNGTLLPPDDLEAWENALKTFFDAPECTQEMVLRGQEEMDARYSIDRTVGALMTQAMRYRS